MIRGYALLGATWLILKTEDHVQRRAYTIAFWAAPLTLAMIGVVSLWPPFLNPLYVARWFGWPNILLAIPVPLLVLAAAYKLLKGLTERRETGPFLAALSLFVLSSIGISISFFPNSVPIPLRSGTPPRPTIVCRSCW